MASLQKVSSSPGQWLWHTPSSISYSIHTQIYTKKQEEADRGFLLWFRKNLDNIYLWNPWKNRRVHRECYCYLFYMLLQTTWDIEFVLARVEETFNFGLTQFRYTLFADSYLLHRSFELFFHFLSAEKVEPPIFDWVIVIANRWYSFIMRILNGLIAKNQGAVRWVCLLRIRVLLVNFLEMKFSFFEGGGGFEEPWLSKQIRVIWHKYYT